MTSDELTFAPEGPVELRESVILPWKLMIVDDEPGIHEVTELALKSVTFSGRPLEFIHCYSGQQACDAVMQHGDIAMIILDVVMETDQAGLDVVRYVREVARNQHVRIVLRTGQPGRAPEREVITAFDINDYKDKTELTSSKLFTLIYSCLRSYRDIVAIEAGKRGLSRVIDASAEIFKLSAMESFTRGVIEQLCALVSGKPDAVLIKAQRRSNHLAPRHDDVDWKVLAGTGRFAKAESAVNPRELAGMQRLIEEVVQQRRFFYRDKAYAAYFEDRQGVVHVFILDGVDDLESIDEGIIQIFMRNVSIAYENINLQSDLEETQREIVCLLGEAVERRSMETGNHVRRVAMISELLALAYGLSKEDAVILKYASPLHDLGKIAIPDSVLNKPGLHTPEETTIMRTHAEIGHQLLASSNRTVLKAAGIIANEHHERWDGMGYPQGKAGKDIHIFGRITAVADVFDALANDRCYKKAWPLDRILELFKNERGRQFDPALVDLLIENIEEVQKIQLLYQDQV